jgi:hypothetical protein
MLRRGHSARRSTSYQQRERFADPQAGANGRHHQRAVLRWAGGDEPFNLV